MMTLMMNKVFRGSHLHYSVPAMPKQKGLMDCGLYAIAYATYLGHGKDAQCLATHYFKQELMRAFDQVFRTRAPY